MQCLDLFPAMPSSCDCTAGGCGCDAAEQGCLCIALEPRRAAPGGLAHASVAAIAPAVPSMRGLFTLMAGSLLTAAALIAVAEAHTAPPAGHAAAATRHLQLP